MSGVKIDKELDVITFPGLDVRQCRALVYIKQGFTTSDIARMLGVSRQAVYNWRQKPEFKSALKADVSADLFRADYTLLTRMRKVQDELFNLVTNATDERVRLESIKTYLTYANQVRKVADERWPDPEPLDLDTDSAISDLLTVIEARQEMLTTEALVGVE